MSGSSINPSDSIEDFLVRERLLAGELSPVEFAAHIVEHPKRRSTAGWTKAEPSSFPVKWSLLKSPWLFLQLALLHAGLAASFYFQGWSLNFVVPLVLFAILYLSFSLVLFARSSAVYEIHFFARERRRFRKDATIWARYAETLRESLAALSVDTSETKHSGAPVIRDLLQRARQAMVAAGHVEIILLILRKELDYALLTYSALPDSMSQKSLAEFQELNPHILDRYSDDTSIVHTVQLELGDSQQELVALSESPFNQSDRWALDQFAACLSLAACRNVAFSSSPPKDFFNAESSPRS